jgi:PD-(D/E)XK nuclease superfamily
MTVLAEAPPVVESPFWNGHQYAWDSTALGWLKTCPRLCQYHMIEGWTGKGEKVHLEFGIHYHTALESYDRLRAQGHEHDVTLSFVVKDALIATWDFENNRPWRAAKDLDPDDKTSLKCRENLIRTIVWYLDKFKNDPAQTKIAPSGEPMVELHFQFEIDFNIKLERPYVLCGYLDRIVEFQGQPFVMDRKTTTSTLGSYYFDRYDPDNQMSFYTVASQVAFHTPVKGVIIDAAQIAVGFSRFVRSFVFKTPDQIDEWLKDLKIWLRQAESYAQENYWPQNDKACHLYGGCTFRNICSKSPLVRGRFLESNFERHPWNPLTPR